MDIICKIPYYVLLAHSTLPPRTLYVYTTVRQGIVEYVSVFCNILAAQHVK